MAAPCSDAWGEICCDWHNVLLLLLVVLFIMFILYLCTYIMYCYHYVVNKVEYIAYVLHHWNGYSRDLLLHCKKYWLHLFKFSLVQFPFSCSKFLISSCYHYGELTWIYRVAQKSGPSVCEHNLRKLLLYNGFILVECRP